MRRRTRGVRCCQEGRIGGSSLPNFSLRLASLVISLEGGKGGK